MNDLLELSVNAHGGMQRWDKISRFRVEASITGDLWDLKGRPGGLADVELEGETRDQRIKITPFPWPGCYTTWEPYRQTIETDDGVLVAERRDPAASFRGFTRQTPWDDLQVAYLAGEANWNYIVMPFIFARDDFVVREIEPWLEDGEMWRRLVVTYPGSVVAHHREQTYSFDDDGLLRRLDYSVDILDGFPAVDYPAEYRAFDGIMMPTRRRVYAGNADGTPARDSVPVAIEIMDATFS
jgi:hypothetical protein